MVNEWDVPVAMDDGAALRADVFRPDGAGRYPVILSCGPYAKGLAFQDGYPDQWRIMAEEHPDVTDGSTGRYQNWEVADRGAIDPHTPLAQGWLRLSHRKLDPELSTEHRPYHAHDEIRPVVPGQVYQADIEIWPTSLVIPAGYRVALTVRGRDYEHRHHGGVRLATFSGDMTGCGPFRHDDPRDRPPAITGSRQTLWAGGAREAYLLLPVIPPD
jgi:predicted acyl esterase